MKICIGSRASPQGRPDRGADANFRRTATSHMGGLLPFRRKAGRQVSRRMLPSTPPQNDSRIRKPLSKSPDGALVVICTIWFFGGAHHGASVRNTTRCALQRTSRMECEAGARGAAIPMGVQFPIATTLFGRGSEFWELLRKMNDRRQYAPATLRNRDFIVGVLRDVLPTKGVILEIASGSGEHVVHFARNFPSLVFQPSDREPDALQSVAAWVKAMGVSNVRAPMILDVSQSPWPIASADGIICINMVHISPWEATLGRCQRNGGSSTRRAHALFQMTIYAARARHSANAAERLCL